MRLSVIRLEENRYRMIWTSHHILFDGWSVPILMEEFLSTYELLISAKALPVTDEDKYEDYIRYLERIDKDAEERYWRNYLRGVNQGTLLPFIKPMTERTKGMGEYDSLSIKIEGAVLEKIQGYAQSQRLTINTLIQGVWAFLLYRYIGNPEVLYGVVVSGRPDELPGIEERVGMYINTLVLKGVVDQSAETLNWLRGLQANQVTSRQYQYTALQDVQGWSGIRGDLFDSLLVFENYPVSRLLSSKKWLLEVGDIEVTEQMNYPLTVTVGIGEELSISFSYNTRLLEQAYITAIRDHFEQVLLQITNGAANTLKDIRLLTEVQEQQLLTEFNDTGAAYPKDKSIVDLFEEQVLKNPNATAVVFEGQELSYEELNKRSNQLARYLQKSGVKAETLVPVCVERSLGMIIGILGILKAGGAYVPIDPAYPADRIRYMLEDTGAELLLSSTAGREKLSGSSLSVIELDNDWELIEKERSSDLQASISPEQLAYVIYTSRSTGKPKGGMIEHRSVVSLVKGTGYVAPGEEDTLLATGSPSFDATTFEYWGMLLNGGRLILCSMEELLDSELLKANIDRYEVSVMWFTSSWFN